MSNAMKHYDVSRDDRAVVDNEGTIWVYWPAVERWYYVTDDGLSADDSRDDLPEEYTYNKLDDSAVALIFRGVTLT